MREKRIQQSRSAKKSNARAVRGNRPLTLGELVVAAFDAVGNEVKDVAKVLGSPDLACAIQRRIVVVP